ncbi:hypothetical protein FRC02_005006 [Tulasnella sp. 418]|nr:hypothetical protein FRC02_005006 [Tulasnella sp. 418]
MMNNLLRHRISSTFGVTSGLRHSLRKGHISPLLQASIVSSKRTIFLSKPIMSQSAVQNPEYLTEAPTFQKQEGAGQQHAMKPKPVFDTLYDGSPYKAAGKLEGKKALITGGDSGIGGAVAYLFALEGADVTIQYLPEEEQDAQNVKAEINKRAPKSNLLLIAADLKDEQTCKDLVAKHIQHHGGLDTLVLNHGTQYIQDDLSQMSTEQWLNTFSVNLHPHFYITREALNHLPKGGTITMNSSVNTFKGHPVLVDYTATKGAIVGFARALNVQVAGDKGIRVNGQYDFGISLRIL